MSITMQNLIKWTCYQMKKNQKYTIARVYLKIHRNTCSTCKESPYIAQNVQTSVTFGIDPNGWDP